MRHESSYGTFEEFVREVLKPNTGPAWSVDQFVDELFLDTDDEVIPGITPPKRAEDEEEGDFE